MFNGIKEDARGVHSCALGSDIVGCEVGDMRAGDRYRRVLCVGLRTAHDTVEVVALYVTVCVCGGATCDFFEQSKESFHFPILNSIFKWDCVVRQ